MTGWLTVIGAILQVVFLLLQTHAATEADIKASKAAQAKDISDAISTGNISLINAAIMRVRS